MSKQLGMIIKIAIIGSLFFIGLFLMGVLLVAPSTLDRNYSQDQYKEVLDYLKKHAAGDCVCENLTTGWRCVNRKGEVFKIK